MIKKLNYIFSICIIGLENTLLTLLSYVLWPKRLSDKYDNICVFKPGNIGDLMCAIPSFNKIRERYNLANITLLSHGGRSLNASVILEGYNVFDTIDLYHVQDTHDIVKLKKFIQSQRRKHYDCMIFMPSENSGFLSQLKNMLIFKCCKIKVVRGFHVSCINIFNKSQKKYRKFDREVIRQLKALPFNHNGIVNFNFPISENDKYIVNKTLSEYEINPYDLMLISPEGKAPANSWPVGSFNQIAVRWQEIGFTSAIIGSGIDLPIIDGICYGNSTVNLTNKFTIAQSLYLMSISKFVLSVDTGTAHMASVVNAPCVGLYSSRNMPQKWFPYGDKVTVLSVELSCSPCLKPVCVKNNECMRAISVDMVWETIEQKILKIGEK